MSGKNERLALKEEEENEEESSGSGAGWIFAAVALGAAAAGAAAYLSNKKEPYKCFNGREKCSVYLDGHPVSILPCGHSQHTSCVLQWLAKYQTCPVCNYSIRPMELDIIRKQAVANSSGFRSSR